jgi:cytochrome P450
MSAPVAFPFPSPSRHHPAPELLELVEREPVAQVRLPDGRTAWLVTGYEQTRRVLTDQRFSRARAVAAAGGKGGGAVIATQSMLGLDPPEHTRLRKLVSSAFTARRIEQLRPEITGIVDDLLESLRAGPRPADLVSGFALPLPVQVICAMLGVPKEDKDRFHVWSDALLGDWNSDQGEMAAAFDNLCAYMAELIAAKRARPADDLMTALIAARDDSDRLSEDELVKLGVTLLFAGHQTTATQITMSLLTLLTDLPELDRLRADEALVPAAVEELMRYVQLIGGGGAIPLARVTTEEVTLGSVTLPEGALVLPALPAANRDPSVFPEPNRFDVTRAPGAIHLGFGAGIHHCLGAQLARINLQEAFRGLLFRLPGLRLAVAPEELRFKDSVFINGLHELPVVWDAV